MKRIQALLILIALLVAPFLKAPAWYFCSMRSGAPQAACCCGPDADADASSSCCRIVQLPASERFGTVAPVVSAPDLVGIMAVALAVVPVGIDRNGPIALPNRAPPRAAGPPLYLLLSSFLS